MDIKEAEDCVRLVPIFAGMAEPAVRQIAGLVRDHDYAAREFLFNAGEDADRLFIIARGQVKVTSDTASGREQMLRLLTPGDFDGEAVLFNAGAYTTTAEALMPVQACTISRADFQGLLQAQPALALNVLNALGQRVVSLETQAAAVTASSVGERLANYLVETAATLGGDVFTLPLRKKDLAAYLGTSPETVSRRLRTFEDAGYLTQPRRGQIKLLDADGLLLASQK
ncbi:Crp/Fnr family transcriptional regulator [Lacticaseibacillus pabuli]|uniref:Crp/Fnr family transcriptional regulator n=1 Tax=Lacticaseibacillus pabuli TaxID=3025672 RepID=A0ABY7WRY0_9LACO|nr:Crp/Fnr family transcriptional regulator [Lacticaseibacillus sp. KACC 23028]WDF82917.1 Crp/Fnr family transcriptional regulator [Lacticaseibacillus sp. KACC 23028]